MAKVPVFVHGEHGRYTVRVGEVSGNHCIITGELLLETLAKTVRTGGFAGDILYGNNDFSSGVVSCYCEIYSNGERLVKLWLPSRLLVQGVGFAPCTFQRLTPAKCCALNLGALGA